MTDTITITTTDRSLWCLAFKLQIEGIEFIPPLETKAFPSRDKVYSFTLNIIKTVGVPLLVAWLSEQIKSHPESVTKIENQAITEDHRQITNVIMKHVTINEYYGEKRPDKERVPQE